METRPRYVAQLPYVDAASIARVAEEFAGIGTKGIIDQEWQARQDDPVYADAMKALEPFAFSIGLGGRETDGARTYEIEPLIDFELGANKARKMIAAQYEANGGSLPMLTPEAVAASAQQQLEIASISDSAREYLLEYWDRLRDSGCGEDMLDALTGEDTSLLQEVGALLTISLYAEQGQPQKDWAQRIKGLAGNIGKSIFRDSQSR